MGSEAQKCLQLHLSFNVAMDPQPDEAVVLMIATAQLAYAHCTLREEHGADGVVVCVLTFGHLSDLHNELELMRRISLKVTRNMALARLMHQETANVTFRSGLHPWVRHAQCPEIEEHYVADGSQRPRHVSTHIVVSQCAHHNPYTLMGIEVVSQILSKIRHCPTELNKQQSLNGLEQKLLRDNDDDDESHGKLMGS